MNISVVSGRDRGEGMHVPVDISLTEYTKLQEQECRALLGLLGEMGIATADRVYGPGDAIYNEGEYGEGEGEQEDQQQDQDPERYALPHLVSSLEYEPSRHSNPIQEVRLTAFVRVRRRVMYNVAMCSTLNPEASKDRRGFVAAFQWRDARDS